MRGPVRHAWEEALHKRIADDADFFDLGGNSMAAISICNQLEEALRVRPRLRTIFDNPRFTDYVAEISKIVKETP